MPVSELFEEAGHILDDNWSVQVEVIARSAELQRAQSGVALPIGVLTRGKVYPLLGFGQPV